MTKFYVGQTVWRTKEDNIGTIPAGTVGRVTQVSERKRSIQYVSVLWVGHRDRCYTQPEIHLTTIDPNPQPTQQEAPVPESRNNEPTCPDKLKRERARIDALRFIAALDAMDAKVKELHPEARPEEPAPLVERAAMMRASMDLTRSLAALRKR